MTLTIGRASSLRPHRISPRSSGRVVTFEGTIQASDNNEVKARRQQLLGLVDNRDEEVVPIFWTSDATFDGFYRPLSADVGMLGPSGGKKGWFRVEAEKLPGFGYPWFEVTASGVQRTNAHAPGSLANVSSGLYPKTGSPYTLEAFDWGVFAASGDERGPLDSASPDSGITLYTSTKAVPFLNETFRFSLPPSLFYAGSARIELLRGSTWYPAVGREIESATVWRLSNGFIRLTSQNGSTQGKLETYDSVNGWESQNVKHYVPTGNISGIGRGDTSLNIQAKVTILRNSPETVVIRCTSPLSALSLASISVTYTIQRGARHIGVSWTSTTTTNSGPAMGSATAMTASGHALYQSTAVAGNVIVFTSPQAFTTDTTNGSLRNTSAAASGQYAFCVYQGSPDATTAKLVADEFINAVSWRQQVVVR